MVKVSGYHQSPGKSHFHGSKRKTERSVLCCLGVEILLFFHIQSSGYTSQCQEAGLVFTEIGDLSYVSDGPRKITTYGLLAVYQSGQASKADLSREMTGQSS